MLQSSAFASPPIPLSHYPEKKNRRKEKVDRGERAETDANHGSEGNRAGSLGRLISLPHSMVAMPQTVAA
jgi:hypothetical protein